MQIHQPVPHGLLFSIEPQDFNKLNLSDSSIHDEFDWEEESECAEESLANNVIAFLKEMAGE